MSEAFLKVVNMSISAGWLVLAVLALRLILKKAPKWVNVLLWGIVAVRLICPFSIESALSLIPSTETISPEIMMDWTPEISTGIEPLDQVVNPVISTSFAPQGMASANPLQILIPVAANLWLLGVLILLAYTAISYLTLRHKLRTAVILRDNIFQCETVSSPFVLGILKPKIYLPYTMDGNNLDHVVAHEKAHIKRKDHWWKPLGFLLLTVYWFNPLMWVAYILLCRDIELACDEKVIAELGNEQRADYTHALVACAVNRRMIAACPLAFGEVGVKDRVKSIMNYRKPTFWIVVTALVVCVAVAVCFLTDPAGTSLTKWTIDEVDMSDTLGDIDTMSVQYYGDSITCNNNDINRFVATMSKIKVGRNSLSQSRDENRDYAFTITINDGLHLHFTIDFSEIWVDNGVKPSFSYPITNPETAMELMLDFSFAHKGTVERWFDYSDNPSEMQWDGRMEANIPEFPDVTFRWYPEKMDAVTEEGITTLYTGMPIWSAYFCDLTGDGIPEICSQVSFGSGIIDSRVIIHDYANGVSYKLEDRGYHDYYLRMNDADGYLYVDKLIYNSDELVSSGRLVFTDGCIQIEGVDSAPTNILQAKLLEIQDGYFLLEPVEGSWELSSASQIEVPMKNMASSPEPQVGDILEIEYDGQLQETYPARITAVYGIRVISERPYVTEALTLNEVAELVKQQHTVSFVGMTREAVHGYWRKPDYEAFGFFGDIYHVPDTFESVVFRYDESEIVTDVEIEYRNEVPGDALFIVEIRDREKEEHLNCAEAEELFFEDDEYEYYFNAIKSHYVIVTYNDANSEDIITALNSGRATIADLDEFDIEYTKKPKS